MTPRSVDLGGLLLTVAAALVAIGACTAAVEFGFAGAWELAGVLGVGGALVLIVHPPAPTGGPRNTNVHGAARTAGETEAQAAARGTSKAADLHEHKFSD